MCGRYTLEDNLEKMEKWFDADAEDIEQLSPNYNVAPTTEMPVVGENREDKRTIRRFRWGYIPFWAEEEDTEYSMINARAESLESKRSYKRSFEQYRCLVPASGFYEWKGEKGNKTPYYIYPSHEPLFSFAGLYNIWESPEGEKIPTYTIITTDANEKVGEIHDRMPGMLLKEEWDKWLDPENHDTRTLQELLQPFPDDAMELYQVSREVNNVQNNSEDLIEPVEK